MPIQQLASVALLEVCGLVQMALQLQLQTLASLLLLLFNGVLGLELNTQIQPLLLAMLWEWTGQTLMTLLRLATLLGFHMSRFIGGAAGLVHCIPLLRLRQATPQPFPFPTNQGKL